MTTPVPSLALHPTFQMVASKVIHYFNRPRRRLAHHATSSRFHRIARKSLTCQRKATESRSAAGKRAKAIAQTSESDVEMDVVEKVVGKTPAKRGRGRKSALETTHVTNTDAEGRATGNRVPAGEMIEPVETVITKVIEKTIIDKDKEEALGRQLNAVKSLEQAAEHKIEAAGSRIHTFGAEIASLEKQTEETSSLRSRVKALERVIVAKEIEMSEMQRKTKQAINTIRHEEKSHDLKEIEKIVTQTTTQLKTQAATASHAHDKQMIELTHQVKALPKEYEHAKRTSHEREQVIVIKERECHELLAAKEKEFKHIAEQVRKEDSAQEAKDLALLEVVRAKEIKEAELRHKVERLETFEVVPCPVERLEDLFALRARVWIAEGADPAAFDAGRWTDGHDAHRTHWMVLDGDQLIAGASMSMHDRLADMDEPEAYAGLDLPITGRIAAPARVIVDAAYRGSGIGQMLLDTQDQAASAAGAVIAVRQASPAMRRLLERRGWRYHGAVPVYPGFPGIEFSVMTFTPGAP
jgi:GNAT superfamily N-acetyltransferase